MAKRAKSYEKSGADRKSDKRSKLKEGSAAEEAKDRKAAKGKKRK